MLFEAADFDTWISAAQIRVPDTCSSACMNVVVHKDAVTITTKIFLLQPRNPGV